MIEKGSASIFLELRNGDISIYHGENKVILHHFSQVAEGAWGEMFDCIVEQLARKEEN